MEGSYVTFSRPVAGIPAGEPVKVCPENAGILEQAARQDLTPNKIGSAWADRTRFVHANQRGRRSRAPLFS
jgi:hypothetical protein